MEIALHGHYGYRRLAVSSIPSILMMVVGSIYSVVDGLFVSNLVGTSAFAALNIIWPAVMIVGALGLGCSAPWFFPPSGWLSCSWCLCCS